MNWAPSMLESSLGGLGPWAPTWKSTWSRYVCIRNLYLSWSTQRYLWLLKKKKKKKAGGGVLQSLTSHGWPCKCSDVAVSVIIFLRISKIKKKKLSKVFIPLNSMMYCHWPFVWNRFSLVITFCLLYWLAAARWPFHSSYYREMLINLRLQTKELNVVSKHCIHMLKIKSISDIFWKFYKYR